MAVINVDGLRKSYGSVRALEDIHLQVDRGDVVGFLGPNGAGKSTAIRILLGLLRADAGTAVVLGKDPWRDAVSLHRRLAYVPGEVNLWPNLTGGEAIDVLAGLRGPVDQARRAELIEQFELDPSKKCGTYSKGNRQKVALVAAFAAEVELLVLDEPTSGLDPLMEAVFDDCIRQATSRGASVLLSSHLLSQVEKLCDSLTIIRSGRVVEAGTLDELRHLTRTHVQATVATRPQLTKDESGIHNLHLVDDQVEFDVETDHLDAAIASLSVAGIKTLQCQPPSLEDLFLRHYSTAEAQS